MYVNTACNLTLFMSTVHTQENDTYFCYFFNSFQLFLYNALLFGKVIQKIQYWFIDVHSGVHMFCGIEL